MMNKSIRAAQRRRYLFICVLSPLLILAVWTLVAANGWVKATQLPSPGMIVDSLADMVAHGYAGVSLSAHIGTSLMRVLTAYVLGSVSGTVVGMLRGRVSWIDAAFLVPAEILRPMPPLGMIPLFILWFGIGELSKIALIFICVFLIMMVNAQAGASNCHPDSIRAAESLGASRRQIFLYVIFPSALPQIMTGLRIAMGSALSVLVASELLGGDRGLGFLVLDASNFFRTSYVFAGIIIIGMIGLISDRALAWISRRVVHWQGSR
jgi:NitT/TauT family transport system permease protein/taurine transport system permease protein